MIKLKHNQIWYSTVTNGLYVCEWCGTEWAFDDGIEFFFMHECFLHNGFVFIGEL